MRIDKSTVITTGSASLPVAAGSALKIPATGAFAAFFTSTGRNIPENKSIHIITIQPAGSSKILGPAFVPASWQLKTAAMNWPSDKQY